MRKGMILAVALVMFTAGFAQAVEEELGIDFDATWVSKYIWRGIDKLDDKAAFQPSINVDLYGTGFSVNVWTSQAGSSKGDGALSTVDREEWRYAVTYGNSVFDGESYRTNYALSWIYYDYPDIASNDADMQEFNLALSWPDICPAGVVPSYTAIYMWPAEGNGAVRKSSGFIHVFGLGYGLEVAEMPNPLNFGVAAVFNDGTVANTVDHDWSHILWSVSTSIDVPMGGKLTPGLYYQTSMDDSVNTEDEFWVSLSYGFSF
jgi:uncharacterized protein (TIGR02001 family)